MILKDKNSILEALKHGRNITIVRFYSSTERDDRLAEIADEARARKIRISVDAHFKDSRGRNRADTVVEAECEEFTYTDFSEMLAGARKRGKAAQIVALDHIQDPHNLGAVIRSAAAAGADGVIIQHNRCCPVTAAVYETSCGGAEHVKVAQVTNLSNALRDLKENGFWAAGADERADKSVYETDLNVPLVWVLGTEGTGMHRLVREHCDFLVKIPTAKSFTSLNVSVATGVLLFEAVRQKKK